MAKITVYCSNENCEYIEELDLNGLELLDDIFSILKESGWSIIGGDYFCPICTKEF